MKSNIKKQKAQSTKHKASGTFRSVVLAITICLTFQAQAQVINLDSVLLLIDKQNPMLQEYDNKVKALEAYTEGAKSWMPPMVGAGTFMTPYPGQMIMDERGKGMFMATIEQDIPNPAKLNAKHNYFASRADVVQQGRAVQYNALRAEAKTFYYQWLVSEKKLQVLRENERIMELMLKLAHIRYPYNQGSLGNIYKAEGRLYEIENVILMTQGEIEGKSQSLKALMNLPSEISIKIDTTLEIHFHPHKVFTDTIAVHEQRSDVKQLDLMIESMRLNRHHQKAQAKPDFKIRFDHMYPRGPGMPQQFTLMGMISIPIAPWSSKMYRSEIKGMTYEIEALKKHKEALLIQSRGELGSMSVQLISHGQQLENYETKIIPALTRNYETLMLAYEENREQLPIVIDAWEALNMTQMEYLSQLEEHYMMIVNYEKELEK